MSLYDDENASILFTPEWKAAEAYAEAETDQNSPDFFWVDLRDAFLAGVAWSKQHPPTALEMAHNALCQLTETIKDLK